MGIKRATSTSHTGKKTDFLWLVLQCVWVCVCVCVCVCSESVVTCPLIWLCSKCWLMTSCRECDLIYICRVVFSQLPAASPQVSNHIEGELNCSICWRDWRDLESIQSVLARDGVYLLKFSWNQTGLSLQSLFELISCRNFQFFFAVVPCAI